MKYENIRNKLCLEIVILWESTCLNVIFPAVFFLYYCYFLHFNVEIAAKPLMNECMWQWLAPEMVWWHPSLGTGCWRVSLPELLESHCPSKLTVLNQWYDLRQFHGTRLMSKRNTANSSWNTYSGWALNAAFRIWKVNFHWLQCSGGRWAKPCNLAEF